MYSSHGQANSTDSRTNVVLAHASSYQELSMSTSFMFDGSWMLQQQVVKELPGTLVFRHPEIRLGNADQRGADHEDASRNCGDRSGK